MTAQRKDDVSSVKTIVDWFDTSVADSNEKMMRSIERMNPPSHKRRILPHSQMIHAFERISIVWKIVIVFALFALVLTSLTRQGDINRAKVMGAGDSALEKDEVFVPKVYKELLSNAKTTECAKEADDDLSRLLKTLGMSEYREPFATRSLTLSTLARVWPNAAKWSQLLSLVIHDDERSSLLRFAVFLTSFGPGAVAIENLPERLHFLSAHGIDSLSTCATASDAVMKPLVEAMQELGHEEQGEYARILAECTQ